MSSAREIAKIYRTTKKENPLTKKESTEIARNISLHGYFAISRPIIDISKYEEFVDWFNNQPTEERDGLSFYISEMDNDINRNLQMEPFKAIIALDKPRKFLYL